MRTYSVPGISCDHCKHAIEDVLSVVTGVEQVEVDIASRTVSVDGGAGNSVRSAIEEAGYEVEGITV